MKFNHSETNEDLVKIGVYTITNLINQKMYVGSTSMSFKYRWRKHYNKLSIGTHENQKLQNAWNKYGGSNFKFEILEITDKNLTISTEQFWINMLSPIKNGYNISPTSSSPKGYKHSEEVKQKMSLNKIGNKNRSGTKHSENIKNQIKTSVKNFYKNDIEKVLQLKELKSKTMIKFNNSYDYSKNKIKIVQLNSFDNSFIRIWDSSKDIENKLGFKSTNITQCCKGKYKTSKGFVWKYLHDFVTNLKPIT